MTEDQGHLAVGLGQLPFAPKVLGRISAVREWGEERGFVPLTVPRREADATDGWELSGVAAQVRGARGEYCAPSENGLRYMAIMSLRNAKA
jgi:hypothetical protein